MNILESIGAELEYMGLDVESLTENYYTTLAALGEFVLMAWNILFVLLLAWAAGKAIQLAAGLGLRALKFDSLADRAGFGRLLRKIGVDNLPSYVVANVLYWFILFFGAVVSISATRQTPLMNHINQMLMFIPHILAALVILVITRYIAQFLFLASRGVLGGAGVPHSERYGWVIFILFWLVGVGTSLMAMGAEESHLLLIGEVLIYAFAVGVAAFAVTAAFVAAREIVYGYFVRARLVPGEEIIVDGAPGTVKRMSGFAVEVYQQGNLVVLPYSRLGADVLKKKVIG